MSTAEVSVVSLFFFILFIFFTLQYCIGFAIHQHASATGVHVFPTSPKLPVSCIKPGLAIHFLYDIIHVLLPFSQIIPPPSLFHRVQKTVLYICVSFAVSGHFTKIKHLHFLHSFKEFNSDQFWRRASLQILRCSYPCSIVDHWNCKSQASAICEPWTSRCSRWF